MNLQGATIAAVDTSAPNGTVVGQNTVQSDGTFSLSIGTSGQTQRSVQIIVLNPGKLMLLLNFKSTDGSIGQTLVVSAGAGAVNVGAAALQNGTLTVDLSQLDSQRGVRVAANNDNLNSDDGDVSAILKVIQDNRLGPNSAT